MKELADKLSKVSNEYFVVGNTLYFDPVHKFSLSCVIHAKHEPFIHYNNTPGAAEERQKARLTECKDKLEHLVSPIFEYRNKLQYLGPDGFDSRFIEELYAKVLNSDWTKVEAAEGIEQKLNELKETAVLSR